MRLRQNILSSTIALVLLLAPAAAGAQSQITANPSMSGMTKRQSEILAMAVNPSQGALTKELHAEFWRPAIQQFGKPTTEDVRAIQAFAEEYLAIALVYQRETWASALASAKAKTVTYSPGYQAARDRVLKGSSIIPMKPEQLRSAVENGVLVIKAAASGAAVNARGETFYVTEENAARVLGGLDGALLRVKRLFNPEWSETLARSERRHDDIKIAIISDEPFDRIEETVQIGSSPAKIVQLVHTLSQVDSRAVVALRRPVPISSALVTETLKNVAAQSIQSVGGNRVGVFVVASFRGAPSVESTAQFVVDGKMLWASYRAIYRENHVQVLQVMGMADSAIKAMHNRTILENDLRLID